MRRAFVIGASFPWMAGCLSILGGPGDTPDIVVRGTPERVSAAVADVFHANGIPVVGESAGEVRSGVFQVRGSWQGQDIERRVECGPDGQLHLAGLTVELSVVAYIARMVVADPGTDPATPRSRIVLMSEGRAEDAGESRCRLRSTFADEILTTTAGITGRGVVARANSIARKR
jgi:hypothetical protein